MKFSIRLLLMLVLLVAVFFAGWVAKTNYAVKENMAAARLLGTFEVDVEEGDHVGFVIN